MSSDLSRACAGRKSRYKAVIYDCDGVMFDSFAANLAFYNRIMTTLGHAPLDRSDTERMRILHTFANRDVLAYLFPDVEEHAAALKAAAAIDYHEVMPFMRMEEGLRETLELLAPQVSLAVCTNRSTSMESVLASFDLSHYFTCVMTASKAERPKPYPDPLLKVLEQFRIAAGEALFVGDSEVDSRAAEASAVPFIAYKADLPSLGRIDHHEEIFHFL